MFSKEMVINVITEYVICKQEGAFDTTYFEGVIHGMLVGLGVHENVVSLCELYSEVLIALIRTGGNGNENESKIR